MRDYEYYYDDYAEDRTHGRDDYSIVMVMIDVM